MVSRDSDGPGIIERLPRFEWMLLHPSMALAISDLKELRTSCGQTAFVIEPVEFIRHRFKRDEEKDSCWGTSAVLVATEN